MSYLDRLRGIAKTASEEEGTPVDLSTISGADLLAGLNDGSIVLSEPEAPAAVETPAEKAPEGIEALSDEQLQALATELETPVEKTASDEEAAYWDAAGRTFARGFLAETAGPEITGDTNVLDALEKTAANPAVLKGAAAKGVKTLKELREGFIRDARSGRDWERASKAAVEKTAGVDKTVRGMGNWIIKNVTPMGRRNAEAVEQVGKQTGKLKKLLAAEAPDAPKKAISGAMKDLIKDPSKAGAGTPVSGRLAKLIKAKGNAEATASSKLGQRVAGYGALGLGGAAAVGTTAAVANKLTD